MEAGGKGKAHIIPSGDIEFIQLNTTDPWTEVDGERASIKTKHFAFSDPAVRQAMALLVDRKGIQEFIYGRTGVATRNFLNNPPTLPLAEHQVRVQRRQGQRRSSTPPAGRSGADGIREKDGKKLKFVFQTSINAPRQKTQAIIKQACQKAGIDLELKSVTASVFFSSDVANPDTYGKFYADMQMYTTTMTQPDPERFMDQFIVVRRWRPRTTSGRAATSRAGATRSTTRLYAAAEVELDPVKRAALFITHERPGGQRQPSSSR